MKTTNINIRHILLIVFLISTCPLRMTAHDLKGHKNDFYCVLPFDTTKSAKKLPKHRELDAWMTYISRDLIDKYKGDPRDEYGGLCFYDYLKFKYPGFRCKHRILFHWGYNSRPWNEQLQKKVETLCWDSVTVAAFKKDIIREQKFRNRILNTMTENLFSFNSSGKEADWANAIVSIVYDTHILGDYTPDNSDLIGLPPLSVVCSDINNAIRKLDGQRGSEIIKEIRRIEKEDTDIQIKAEKILEYMKKVIPNFIIDANEGRFKRRFEKIGFKIRKHS